MPSLLRTGAPLLAWAALTGCSPEAAAPREGEAFPELSFPRLGAPGELRLPPRGAGPTVVNVWATWCEPCRREMRSLERLHRMAPLGARVIGISVDTDAFLAEEFVRREGLTFDNGRDAAGVLSGGAMVTKFPTTFVVDARGTVRWREEAARDWSEPATLERLRRALEGAA